MICLWRGHQVYLVEDQQVGELDLKEIPVQGRVICHFRRRGKWNILNIGHERGL